MLPPRWLWTAPRLWSGAITIGFLLDAWDHKVPFAKGGKTGLDLMLRIEAAPALGTLRQSTLEVLKAKAAAVRAAGGEVRLLDDPKNGNRHTLLIAQRDLGELVSELRSESEQIAAIYAQINAWLQALFDDGALARALPDLEPSPSGSNGVGARTVP
jgi:hypothetical protein